MILRFKQYIKEEENEKPEVDVEPSSTKTQEPPLIAQKVVLKDLPYEEKVGMFVRMAKEYGFGNIDYQIHDGMNKLILDGSASEEFKQSLIKFSKELDIEIEVKEIKNDSKSKDTHITLKNNIDYDKWIKIISDIKQKEKDKEELLKYGTAGISPKEFIPDPPA